MKSLLVLGATGLMGRRVCAIAAKQLPDVRLIRASRSLTSSAETRRADHRDLDSLRKAFEGIDCVINAAGPYDYHPHKLLEACFESGCHYVDLAESRAFHSGVAAAARRWAPERRGLSWVPGASTVPGLIEVLTAAWSKDSRLKRIDAYLSLGSRNPTSRTLLYSLLEPIAGRAADGTEYFAGTLKRTSRDGKPLRYGRYAYPRDPDQNLDASDRLEHRFFVGFDRALYTRTLSWAQPLLRALPPGALRWSAAAARPLVSGLSLFGTRVGRLEVVALDASETELGASWVIAARQGLDIPAAPAVWAAARLLGPHAPPSGVRGLAELVPAQGARDWLTQHGYVVGERWS